MVFIQYKHELNTQVCSCLTHRCIKWKTLFNTAISNSVHPFIITFSITVLIYLNHRPKPLVFGDETVQPPSQPEKKPE